MPSAEQIDFASRIQSAFTGGSGVRNVQLALDDLANQIANFSPGGLTVQDYTSSGRILMTGASDSVVVESGASVDPTGAISSQGSDISTGGGNFVTGPGLVDGRDVSVDGTKLDTIETSADVTDATNVAAAGAVMDADFGTNGLCIRSSAGAYNNRTLTAGTGISVANGTGLLGNPTVTLNAALSDLNNFGTVGKNEILYYDGTNTIQGDSLPGQVVALVLSSNNSSSGNLYLRPGIASSMSAGVGGTIQIGIPWAASIVGMSVTYQVTAWTSGGIDVEINVEDGGAGWAIELSEQTTATGIGDFKAVYSYTAGTYAFGADSYIGVKCDHNNAGSVLTTDDQTVTVYLLLDSNVVTLA